jgi:hypothetical protein
MQSLQPELSVAAVIRRRQLFKLGLESDRLSLCDLVVQLSGSAINSLDSLKGTSIRMRFAFNPSELGVAGARFATLGSQVFVDSC